MSLVAGHPSLSGNQSAGLVTISTAASGATSSSSARRPPADRDAARRQVQPVWPAFGSPPGRYPARLAPTIAIFA